MANFFYIDSTGTKQGPFSQEQLKALAQQGSINPQTPLETDDGHQGKAGQIEGLFPAAIPVPPVSPIPPSFAVKHYCTSCGSEVNEKAVACPKCGVPPHKEKNFCYDCGTQINPNQIICVKCGSKITTHGGGIGLGLESLGMSSTGSKSRMAYILLGLLPCFCCGLGGIHNLYVGYTGKGLTQLLTTIVNTVLALVLAPLTLGLWTVVSILVGLGIFIWQVIEVCTVTADSNGQPFA